MEWIVVHVTAMRDSKGKAPSSVLEKMRSDFDSKGGGGLPRLAHQDVTTAAITYVCAYALLDGSFLLWCFQCC